jgi:ssDNA-binding Zn-finger/Zn-ribbon topoisomerase 1
MTTINNPTINSQNIINKLINFLITYKTDPKYTFYKHALDRLKELQKKNIIENKQINRIQQKSYILEPLRIYLLSNNYNIFLSNKKYTNCNYVKYNLTQIEKDNFLTLIVLSEEFKSNILELKKIDINKIKNILSDKCIYLNICDKSDINIDSENIYPIKNMYDSLTFLLGIESIKILKYQRLDRIKEFLDNPEAYKVFEILQSYNNYIHTLSNKDRDDYR